MDSRVAGRAIGQIRRYRTNQSVDCRCQGEPRFLYFAFHPADLVGLFPPPLHKYLDPKRYRYAVIGSKDDAMGDLLPPRSLVEIDVVQNAVQMSGWTSVRERPIYLVWHNNGHSCCWCQVQTYPAALPALPSARETLKFASGRLCNRASDKLLWLPPDPTVER